MAKLSGPLHALRASGSLAETLSFARAGGSNYVKTYSRPRNPRSSSQSSFRAVLSFLSASWSSLSAANQATWKSFADQRSLPSYQAFLSVNLSRWGNYDTPSQTYPPPEASPIPPPQSWVVDLLDNRPRVKIFYVSPYPTWGYILFRTLTSGFTPNPSNAIALFVTNPIPQTWFYDTLLPPATYYYRLLLFNDDGIRYTHAGERTATVS